MTQQRTRRDGKPWHNNIGPWIEALTADEKKALVQKATRAQWGPVKEGPKKADDGAWIWPFDVNKYDRQGELSVTEADVLTRYAEAYRFYRFGRTMDFGPVLDRIIRPLNDALDYTGCKTGIRRYVLLFFLRETAERNRTFWTWTTEEWIDSIDRWAPGRQQVVAIAYLLCGFSDLHRLKSDHIVYVCLARKVFGPEYMRVVTERVQAVLLDWGYARDGVRKNVMRTVFEALLFIRSPHLCDLKLDSLEALIARRQQRVGSWCSVALSRVLASMGSVPEAWRSSDQSKVNDSPWHLLLVSLKSGCGSARSGTTVLFTRRDPGR